MAEAVGRLVRPGSTLVMGAALEAAIPFAVGHEIIRRRIRGLTLVGPISDALFDMMVGGRVVDRIIAAWVGNVGTGLGYCFGRAVRDGLIRVTDHSNLSVATALEAGGMGVEFGVIRSLFGADILAGNPDLVRVACPFTDTPHLAVRAIRPDLAVVHVQRADEEGNAQYWGNLGILPEAVRASRQVLVVAEEIVPPETIRSDPNRTLVPSFKTAAVVHEPWGAHPSPLQGHYGHDDDFYVQYARATRDPDSAEKWFGEWVFGVPHRAAYVKKLGSDRIRDLALKTSAPAAPVEYGF
jgi:glutaconate CoA-transferase subunit A